MKNCLLTKMVRIIITMSSEKLSDRQPKQKKSGLIELLSNILKTLFFSLIISIIIELVGIYFFWPEEGDLHSEKMLISEFGYLSQDFVNSFIISKPVQFTESLITEAYDLLAIKTGLLEIINEPINDSNSLIVLLLSSIGIYIKAIINIILVFIVRMVILVLSIPIFLLAGIVGIVDGLVRRDIRRFGAGRESSFLYYYSKSFVKKILILSWIIYLSIPFSIHPNIVFIPTSFLFGLSISITFGSFKKYL